MYEVTIIDEVDNKNMIDIYEEITSLKSLAQSLADNNELFLENSDLYERLKTDLKMTTENYRQAWKRLIDKYYLDESKGDQYILDFNSRKIVYKEEQ